MRPKSPRPSPSPPRIPHCILLVLACVARPDGAVALGAEGSRAPPAPSAPVEDGGSRSEDPPIAVRFHLEEPSFVTLVIERPDGTRVRNLVSETPFPAGSCVAWWDGLDDLGRDPEAARRGLYQIPARFVEPGAYRVRGLARPPIRLVYELSPYNAGSPPWETEDRRGGWLANHTPPSAVLFVPPADAEESPAAPAPRGTILVGSYVAEGGHGLAWLDPDGRKRWGQMWVGGVWTGASHLARDAGTKRVPGVYAYAGAVFEGGGFDGPKPELRLAELLTKGAREAAPRDGRFGTGWDRPLLVPNAPYQGILPNGVEKPSSDGADLRYVFPDNAHVGLAGLAVHDGRLVASLPKMGQLLWVDAARRRIIGAVALEDPRGVAFDPSGRLLALSGRRLLRFSAGGDPLSPGEPEVLVARGLEDPQGIALDPEGRVYIGDWGESHQVKVFGADGAPLRAIGAAGAPRAGPYDPVHMNHPKGIAIDGEGRIWVAEEDFQPRRVSVWSPDGKLAAAFYGPSEYGGGGRLDPEDRTRFYYNGMEFRLDWERGTDRLVSVFHRPGPGDLGVPDGYGAGGPPETPIRLGGRQYMTNCYNSNPTHGAPIAMLWILADGTARPVAALGRANDWKVLKAEAFRPRWPAGADPDGDFWRNQAMFVWSDLDGDARIRPEEVRLWKAASGGITVLPDLSFLAARADERVVRYRPRGVSDGGVPLYDPEAGETLLAGIQPPASSGGDQALLSDDGWTIVTLGPKPFAPESLGGGRDGKALWSYPSLWPGLHASHESPAPDRPGMLVGTTRLLGGFVRPAGGEAGPIWAVNGNMGNAYLFTADGLFVAELFRDVRIGKSWTMPEARRGMALDGLSLHDENFWPTITGTSDGRIYLVDGARTSIIRVEGLEGIRRLPPAPLEVTPELLRAAHAWNLAREAERQRRNGDGVLTVSLRTAPPAVDGKLDDWARASWVTVDDRGTAAFFDSRSQPFSVKAALAVSGDRLYAAFRTGDPDLLRNAGDAIAPFKTGGALDILLGADPKADPERRRPAAGDLRLLVTRTGERTLAVLYRAVVPGTKDPVPFSSPWRTIVLDRVDDISADVRLAGSAGDYEVSVPLGLLGLEPAEGREVRGDIGILRGNGFQTLARVYWHNKATGITSDVPSEAELTPWLWGAFRFQAGE